MTTSKPRFLAVAFLLAAGMAGAQSHPKDLPWAVAEFTGGGEWALRLPQLLVKGWESLPPHRLSEVETTLLRKKFLEAAGASLDQQAARLKLDLDRRRLKGALPATEPDATDKALAALVPKQDQVRLGTTPGATPPETLALRSLWSSDKDRAPWPASDRFTLADRSHATYLVTGEVWSVEAYLKVRVLVSSALEDRILGSWEGQFAPDEALVRMAEASDALRPVFLGRPWAGLEVPSGGAGTLVQVGREWHSLPWSSETLEPGDLSLVFRQPGHPDVVRTVALAPGERLTVVPPEAAPTASLVLETVPPGAALYLDSRFIGPSPQTIDRPGATTRIRAQSPGWETSAWEVGPDTASPSVVTLKPPHPIPSATAAKDEFYWSLAAFSASLTTSAFLGAWAGEQVKLVNAYATAGASEGYHQAYLRYLGINGLYGATSVLTTGLFVWMMFELGDYLGAAQASLP